MKIIVKLLSIAFVLGLLVGCGGTSNNDDISNGGGIGSGNDNNATKGGDDNNTTGGDNNTTVSLGSIESFFPPFPDGGYTFYSRVSHKWYKGASSIFKTSITGNPSYTKNGVYTDYYRNNILPNIYTNIYFPPTGIVDLQLTSLIEKLDDLTYENAFGTVGGDVIYVSLRNAYNGNISQRFYEYTWTTLSEKGFSCSQTNNDYSCQKEVGDILYRWSRYSDKSYTYEIRDLIALPIK